MDPDIPAAFEKETGIKVVLDTFDTNEELYPVIKNRAGVYDVICPSDYMAERMKNEGLLLAVDKKKLPNYKNLSKKYLRMAGESFDKGNRYAVPYQWGAAGILYNKRRVDARDVRSWNVLMSDKYRSGIVMQDSMRDAMGIMLKSMGRSLNSVKRSELAQAAKRLIDQKKLVYKYANDSVRDLLIGNSADLGVVWNGEAIYSIKLNKDLAFSIPKEGTEIFMDNWCIPKNAFHTSNAHKFIDYMCRADVAYRNFKYLTYSTPNAAAVKLIPKKYRTFKELFLPDSMLKQSETLKDVGATGDKLYSEYWKKFKSE